MADGEGVTGRVAFFVSGRPRSTQTGSVIRVGGRSISLRRNTPWSAVCGLVGRQHAPVVPLTGPLAVDLLFTVKAPKSGKRRFPTVRPDAENLVKGLLDAWNGVLYEDDSQVIDLVIRKRYAMTEGVRVEIQTVPDDWSPEYLPASRAGG